VCGCCRGVELVTRTGASSRVLLLRAAVDRQGNSRRARLKRSQTQNDLIGSSFIHSYRPPSSSPHASVLQEGSFSTLATSFIEKILWHGHLSALHPYRGIKMEHLVHSAIPATLRRACCPSCSRALGMSLGSRITHRIGLQNSDRIQWRGKGYIARPGEQARPLQGFYQGRYSHLA
jgi:hypothetical protein